MKLKQILTAALLFFVVASLAYMITTERKTDSKTNPATGKSASPQKQDEVENTIALAEEKNQSSLTKTSDSTTPHNTQLIVYYFYGDVRCPTCHKLETYAKEALDLYFADQLSSKDIVWRAVNVDRPQNHHFITDYELVTKSVVISETIDNREIRWKNLDQIWKKVSDKNDYLNYMRDSIQNFLSESRS